MHSPNSLLADETFAGVYDEYERLSTDDPIDRSRRGIVRKHIENQLKPGDRILEINSGSGIDAAYFAKKGYNVLATDISNKAGLLVRKKSELANLPNLSFEKCSFETLNALAPRKFDYLFSNFGGLNCIDELPEICAGLDNLLTDGGFVTLVVMPKWYPWEIASLLAGNKNALRRFGKNGVESRVGDYRLTTFYHSPRDIRRAMPDHFKHVRTRNIGTFYPSAHFKMTARFPRLISALIKIDNWINESPIAVPGFGDYFMITFQKQAR